MTRIRAPFFRNPTMSSKGLKHRLASFSLAIAAAIAMPGAGATSFQVPLDVVGLAPGCKGTLLGTDDRHAWLLTAARCVAPGWQHLAIFTPTLAASGLSHVYHPPGSDADIALASIPLPVPVSPDWNALAKPMLNDGDTQPGGTEVAIPNSRMMDRGSAGWERHAGYWSIFGVKSGIDEHGDPEFTPVKRHVAWIKGLFPGASTSSERFTVSESRPFVSRNHAEDVAHGTVYYVVAPGQPGVQGPTAGTWILNNAPDHSKITVTAKDAVTGAEHAIVLRASRHTGR